MQFMFMNKDLSEEQREKIIEERRRKRQEFFGTLGSTLKKLLGDIISTARDILYPDESQITSLFAKTVAKEKVAFFWDYENFALPKSKIADDLFFKMIYPSKKKYVVISKRVFSKKQHIQKRLPDIIGEGFEYYQTISTQKNATDKILIQRCLEFCSSSEEKFVIFLITGDSDYISLIKKLVSLGHEVRLIYSSKEKISKEMERLVPIVLDINMLFEKRKRILEKKLSKKDDQVKWEGFWEEYVALEEDLDFQEEALNRIAKSASTTTIRSKAQKTLIELIETRNK